MRHADTEHMLGPLSAGSILVTYGAKRDEASLRRYRDDMRKMADEAERAEKKVEDHNPYTGLVKGADGRWRDARGRFVKINEDMADSAEAAGRRVSSSYNKAGAAMSGLSGAAGRMNSTINRLGRVAMIGGAAVSAAFVGALRATAQFDQQVANVGAVSGASAKELTQLREAALAFGKAGRYSALEVAEAQGELTRAGLSTEQVLGGGLKSALALAAAGQLELGDAAAYTSNAMNLFGISASKTGRIADALASAANMTTADVSDFGLALSQGGSAAKAAGLSFEETVTALSALASIGIKGSDAGTSLKAALIQLLSPTRDAEKEMTRLGLRFTDADGSMKSLVEISGMLQERLGGLTQAQRVNVLSTIAGTDGFRALLSLYDAGPQKVQSMERALSKQGTAAGVADKQNRGLEFSYKRLINTITVIGIRAVDGLKPTIQRAADEVQRQLLALEPKVKAFSKRIGAVLSTDDSWEIKADKVWAEIQRTGLPEKAKEALIAGFGAVAEGAIDTMLAVWKNSDWRGKAFIAAILLAKFGPAFALVGKGLGKVLGGVLGGGKGGGLGGLATKANPVPVIVMNQLPGGVPGGPGGKKSWWRRGLDWGKRVAAPLAGRLAGRVGIPLAVGAMAFNAMRGQAGSQEADFSMAGRAAARGMDESQRKGPAAVKAMRAAIKREMEKIPADMRQAWAKGFIIQTAELEKGGKRARGTTGRVVKELTGEFGAIPLEMAKSAMRTGFQSRRVAAQIKAQEGPTRDASRRVGAATKPVAAGAKNTADATQRQMGRTSQAVKQTETEVKGPLARMKSWFKDTARNIGSFLVRVGKFAALGPVGSLIPGMATGGSIVGPKGAGIPIIAHADEVVLNRQQQDMVASGATIEEALSGTPVLRAGGLYAGGGAGSRSRARSSRVRRDPYPTTPGRQRFEDNILPLSLALARAEGTASPADDKRALYGLVSAYTRRQSAISRLLRDKRNSRKRWPGMWRALMSEQADIASTLNDYRARLKDLGQAPEQLAMAVAGARTDLYAQFGSNFRPVAPPTGGPVQTMGAGKQTTVNNYFQQPPPDPHAFSRSLAFELKGTM